MREGFVLDFPSIPASFGRQLAAPSTGGREARKVKCSEPMEDLPMFKTSTWTCLAVVVLAIVANTSPAVAQLTRGFISGTITDASNAILPGVQVTITNTATNISRDAVSNDSGF